MELYLLRHGIAVDHGTPGYKESERPLTDEGFEKMEAIAAAIKKLKLSFDVILSSPYTRARQTAEVVARELDLMKKLEFTDHLIPSANPKRLIEEIRKNYSKAESLLLAGHEPFLSQFIAALVSGDLDSLFNMRKGGLCKLSVGALAYGKCAMLEWLMTPKQMIAISGK